MEFCLQSDCVVEKRNLFLIITPFTWSSWRFRCKSGSQLLVFFNWKFIRNLVIEQDWSNLTVIARKMKLCAKIRESIKQMLNEPFETGSYR